LLPGWYGRSFALVVVALAVAGLAAAGLAAARLVGAGLVVPGLTVAGRVFGFHECLPASPATLAGKSVTGL